MGLHTVERRACVIYGEHHVYDIDRETLQLMLHNTAAEHTVHVFRIDRSSGPTAAQCLYQAVPDHLDAGARSREKGSAMKSRCIAEKGEVLERPASSDDMPVFVVPPNRRLSAKRTAHQASQEPVEQEPSRHFLSLMAHLIILSVGCVRVTASHILAWIVSKCIS